MSSARPVDGVHSVATQSDPRDAANVRGSGPEEGTLMDETQVTASTRKPHPAAASHEKRKAEVTFRALAVARELIEREGLAAFTVERVAERSGIAKTTLYRRWDDALAMARAAFGLGECEINSATARLQASYPENHSATIVAVLAASVAERLGEKKR